MNDFNEKEFRERIEKTRQELQAYKKSEEKSTMNRDIVNQVTALNSITTPIMVVVGVILCACLYFGDGIAEDLRNAYIEKNTVEEQTESSN